MRAGRYYAAKDIRLDEIEEPAVKPGEVKLKIAWNGICGSDLHEYLAGPLFVPHSHPHPITNETAPLVFGHEFSGTIAEIGEGVDKGRYGVGLKAVVEPVISCNECTACRDGRPNCCPKIGFVGLSGWGGGLGEYVSVPSRIVHIVPDNVPLDVAACIEPLAVAWHAVNRAGFKPGDTCLITGGGPIGLFVLKALLARGAGAVYVSEPAHQRRLAASRHNATHIFNPLTTDVVAEVRKLTDGQGVDIAFDCAGVQASLDCAIAATRSRGVIMNVAIWETNVSINPNNLTFGEKIYTSCLCYVGCHEPVIAALAQGKITNVGDLITKRIGLESIVKEGFEALINDKDNQIKILVHPSKEVPTA